MTKNCAHLRERIRRSKDMTHTSARLYCLFILKELKLLMRQPRTKPIYSVVNPKKEAQLRQPIIPHLFYPDNPCRQPLLLSPSAKPTMLKRMSILHPPPKLSTGEWKN